MPFNPAKHHRRSVRLRGWDYSNAGAYFVTLCAKNRECLFSTVVHGEMQLNEMGRIAAECWEWLEKQYAHVEWDQWVIMPNHMHAIIVLHGRGALQRAPTESQPVKTKSLGQLIGMYKTVSTRRINEFRNTPGIIVWQRNYHEHIVRNDDELIRIRRYIANNPGKWESDLENPALITFAPATNPNPSPR